MNRMMRPRRQPLHPRGAERGQRLSWLRGFLLPLSDFRSRRFISAMKSGKSRYILSSGSGSYAAPLLLRARRDRKPARLLLVQFELRDVQRIHVRDGAIVRLEFDPPQEARYGAVIARRNFVPRSWGERHDKRTKLGRRESRDKVRHDPRRRTPFAQPSASLCLAARLEL